MLRIDRILVPIDFSEPAEQALDHAAELARTYEAQLWLLHVVEEPAFPSFYGAGAMALYGKLPDLDRRARAALAERAAGLGETVRPVQTHVVRGNASASIVAFAEEQDIDLIVIASRGLSGVRGVLLGSVAEKVVRRAPCPVLVVRGDVKSLVSGRAA